MSNVWSVISKLNNDGRPAVIVSVIATSGSSSSRVGSRVILDDNGACIDGWIGGGCIESIVRQESLAVISDGNAKVVQVELDSRELGYGIPCGGRISLYFDPVFPGPRLITSAPHPILERLTSMAKLLGYRVITKREDNALNATAELSRNINHEDVFLDFCPPEARREILISATKCGYYNDILYLSRPDGGKRQIILGPSRNDSLRSLEIIANIRNFLAYDSAPSNGFAFSSDDVVAHPHIELLLLGSGKITNTIRGLAQLLDWQVIDANTGEPSSENCRLDVRIDIPRSSSPRYAIVSGQYKDDHLTLLSTLSLNVDYIALVASRTRASVTRDYLVSHGMSPTAMRRIYSPAGVFQGAKSPQDIALGIVIEILQHIRGQLDDREDWTVARP